MADAKKFYPKSGPTIHLICFLLIALLTWAQSPAPQPQTPAATQPSPQATAQPQASSQEKPSSEAAAPETRISPQQAEELFRSVDVILKFSSQDSALPIKRTIKRRLTSRDEVVAYLHKQMSEDKDAKRLQRSELVLKKFGLLPRDFDLQSFLVALLREQVAGYYDYRTKTVNLLDWVGVEQQRPVLAHELTHALQDQSFDLEKWMKAGDIDLDDKKQPTWDDIQKDEISTARQAVVEGQAMVVLVDYMLMPLGQSILTSRAIVDQLKRGMLVGTDQSPEFENAPIFLKEALTFPYRYGIDFEADLLAARGKQRAFGEVFANPPRTTRQIMEPKTYLSGEQIPPMPLPDFPKTFKNYERFDLGAIGEFDVAVLIDQYAGVEPSRQLFPEWRGGYYYAAKPKDEPDAPLALMYASRWSTPANAEKFAAIYAKSLTTRYRHVHGDDGLVKTLNTLENLSGKHTWLTEEGAVVIEVEGDTVLITESLDQNTTEMLAKEVLPARIAAK